MKRFSVALALMVLVSVSASAGEIPTMGAPQPPPQQTTTTMNPGEIPSVPAAEQLSDAALSAILTALGLALI
ncbi:MAG TPA: hypothetical protein DC047_00180 [Blastocatellia bacterium]|nr:hypothetical protein [Blastocatellia bacterium]